MRAVLSWIEEKTGVEEVGKVKDVGLCNRCRKDGTSIIHFTHPIPLTPHLITFSAHHPFSFITHHPTILNLSTQSKNKRINQVIFSDS
jgi:hypothetical protein